MSIMTPRPKKKRRFSARKKRVLDPNTIIDYKQPDTLRRFVTDRGKVIPRRISGATAKQQREIQLAIKRARCLALLPFGVTHRSDRNRMLEPSPSASGFPDDFGRDRMGGRSMGDRGDRGGGGDGPGGDFEGAGPGGEDSGSPSE